ncbi:MAG: hypothetical protein HOJ79_15530 [Nitrospina sp.]|jgi:hypothetical protein|nr:hypothetical protein [Nitrospina sp.]
MIAQPENICAEIQASLTRSGLFTEGSSDLGNSWRISPEPFFLSSEDAEFFHQLGPHLLKFYTTWNNLYLESIKGSQWFAQYLDAGKPQELIEFGRMKRFRRALPTIIRPDVIVTEDGFAVTELDSVPGGFGLTAELMALYKDPSWNIIGDSEGGIPALFYQMAESLAKQENPCVAIVVSDEAQDYRSEMEWLANIFHKKDLPVYAVHPKEIQFREEGLFILNKGEWLRVDVLYRFFELFDLKNIPKSELMMYAAKKGQVVTTPPYKACLEEKLSFALFHHPSLKPDWEKNLGSETFNTLSHLIPETWVLDSRPLPPYGVIPGLQLRGAPVQNWQELMDLTQKEREMVIKPSGFSPDSWGSRGVVVGHDVSGDAWKETLTKGLQKFPDQTSILQKFYKGKRVPISYLDQNSGQIETIQSRVRLTPYYFVVGDTTHLAGILATLCPQNKKKIHGMVDAVMVPCAIKN